MAIHLAKGFLTSLIILIFSLSNLWAEDDISVLIDQGISLYRQRKYVEARAVLEKAVSATKGPDLYYLLGNTYLHVGTDRKIGEGLSGSP